VSIDVRPLAEADLASADRIFRLAFGTQVGLKDPLSFRGDAEMVRTRWRAQADGAFAAHRDGELVGSSFAARWGSFGIFGPLSVRPDCWDAGIGKRLLEPAVALFERWGVRQAGLFTFAQSPKHIGLYQRFGFWPQHLTSVMAKEIHPSSAGPSPQTGAALDECAAIADANFPGLDAGREIRAVQEQKLGATVLVRESGKLQAFAACHFGKGSEAGSGALFIKFGAVRPGDSASSWFQRLLAACEALAAERGATRVIAGMNTARHDAYRLLLQSGYQGFFNGIAMQRPNAIGFNRSDCFIIDDWR
jgi:GNAT superfamily N-acetyltransferase